MAPTKYSLDEPALNKAANCPEKTSVIKIPKIISAVVYIRPYLIPSRIRFLLHIQYAYAMIGVMASLKPNAKNNTNCWTL